MMFELTGFQRDILYCIADTDDPYGLEIKQQLEEASSIEVNHGRLYPNLDTLVEEGLVEKKAKDDRTNLYLLTEHGINLIKQRRQWEDSKLSEIDLA